ncbi:MAG: glycoside hydrolase domain-containing protein [Armatimonadia bacterium]
MYRFFLFVLVLTLAATVGLAQPAMMIDDMENLSAWKTGGQKEASLKPETVIVKQGKAALRFEVKIDHKADEAIQGQQYPKGWPRVERNPQPPLDLSATGGMAFDIYTLSSRAAMPGNSLNVILRDKSDSNWSANLGELPIRQWKHFKLDFPPSFNRSQIVHWQFFLSESDYNDGDFAAFIIDNVQGYAAQQSRQLVPLVESKLAVLKKLGNAEGLAAEVAQARQKLAGVDQLDLTASVAFDRQCAELLGRLDAKIMEAGARKTSSDGSYCVGTETSLRKVMRDDVSFMPGTSLKLGVAGNERESGQIVLRAVGKDIPKLSAEWGDLTGPGGAELAKDAVSVQAVGYVEVLKANYVRDRDGWWPDPLLPLDWPGSGKAGLGPLATAFAKVGETQPLWVTVRCPAGQKAGTYNGTVTLKPEGLPETKVSLQVQVRGFSLPLRPRLKTAFAYFEGEYRGYYKRPMTEAQRRAVEELLLDHKLNPMNLYTPVAWPGLDDAGFMEGKGLNAYCLGYCPATVQGFGDLAYYHYLRDYRGWLREKGLDRDAWLYGYDEPHCRPDWEQLKGVMREVYSLVDAVAPGLPKASTTAIVPDLFGAVNLWIPQTMQVARKDTLGRQKAGDQVWTYVACTPPHPFANYFVEYPALDQRVLGWQTWEEKCTGFLYYATNLWRPNYDGQDARWPEVPWNPRPAKDFAFNGDGLLIYPHPDGSMLSTVRLEAICDGFEDYDYLCLLRDGAAALRATGKKMELVKQAEAATVVPVELSKSLTEFNHDPAVLLAQREKVAELVEQVKVALGEAAWQKVLKTEPALAPQAPKGQDVGMAALPYACGFEAAGGLTPWTSGGSFGAKASFGAVEGAQGKAGVSTGTGKGWADWETPYLKVQAPQQVAIRLRAKPEYKAGTVRVFLFKYGADRRPLDLATRQQGEYAPALVGSLPSTGAWEKHRFVASVPAGTALVRVYLQAFGLDGSVAWDEVSVSEYQQDPNQVDSMDEMGNWRPGFPESTVAREIELVHEGDAALRYTVKVDHKGGEEKYPIGWPSLTWRPAPALDFTGKQALTFWIYTTTSREKLPGRPLTLSLRSEGGDDLSMPLSLETGKWQQVRVPLAGKRLSKVNYLHFFVEEALYADKDEVSFVIDDMRVE